LMSYDQPAKCGGDIAQRGPRAISMSLRSLSRGRARKAFSGENSVAAAI
jgi:hypothetical protein